MVLPQEKRLKIFYTEKLKNKEKQVYVREREFYKGKNP
jgi:hypothetical protein